MGLKKACCCCCDLAAGTQAIGWFGISIILLQLIAMVSRISNSAVSDGGGVIFHVLGSLVQLILCGFLVAGARQRDNCMLLPWIIVNIIGFIAINVAIIPQIIAETNRKDGGLTTVFIAMLVITDLIYGYFLLVVSSLYIEIKQQKRGANEGINHV